VTEGLVEVQNDALVELANMAVNQAAGRLSELTGRAVEIRIPQIRLLSPEALESYMLEDVGPMSPCINQHFDGPVSGDAILVYPGKSSSELVSLLLEEEGGDEALSAMERSALVEVGNILINSFMGMVAQVLKISLDFSVPHMFLPSPDVVADIMRATLPEEVDIRVAVLIDSEIGIADSSISGHMAFMMDFPTIKAMAGQMEEIWLTS
jgi:chemotaxis protein CheC